MHYIHLSVLSSVSTTIMIGEARAYGLLLALGMPEMEPARFMDEVVSKVIPKPVS